MTTRADAHIHLFAGGYRGGSFASTPGVSIDEARCYDSLAREHDVAAASPPSREQAGNAMRQVTDLAMYPGVRVKLSGFYALTLPGHDFPHQAAWPYVEQLVRVNPIGPRTAHSACHLPKSHSRCSATACIVWQVRSQCPFFQHACHAP
jgi:hypothetical protein